MKIEAAQGSLAEQHADALLIGIHAGNQSGEAGNQLDAALDGELQAALSSVGFTGRSGTVAVLPTFGRLPASRIIAAGLGESSDLTIDGIRSAWGAGARKARESGARSIASAPPPATFGSAGIRAAAEGVRLGLYQHTIYKSDDRSDRAVESVTFTGIDDGDALAAGEQMAAGVSLARDLVNTPGLDLYPEQFAERARNLASELGLECTVYDRAALQEMGAGAIIGVGQGSAREPRLIHLIYRPDGESQGTAGFVGKAITFDTGGVDIKPPDGMRNMKMDMAGGAAVLGAMRAIAGIKPPYTVHAVIAAAENMLSHTAYRPGDVLKTMSGKTVEIHNTDAEGRLVLADALTFTSRQGIDFMIDLATLTGASVVAVGNSAASLFGDDDVLAQDVLQASEFSGERMWRMPLWDDYLTDLDSDIADIANSGSRDGGAIKAALFLREFTHDVPWVHLDIAGPAWSGKETGYRVKCGTGFGTHTLVTLLEQRARG